MKFEFVHQHRDIWPVSVLCRVLGVTPAGHYAHRRHPPSRRTQRRDQLAEAVRVTFADCRRVYGSPRLTRALHARGVACSENTVAKVLRTQGRFGGGGGGPPQARPSPPSNRLTC